MACIDFTKRTLSSALGSTRPEAGRVQRAVYDRARLRLWPTGRRPVHDPRRAAMALHRNPLRRSLHRQLAALWLRLVVRIYSFFPSFHDLL